MNPEKLNQSDEELEKIPEQPETILEKAEMPDNFVEPEGKSGKWGEIVENKELGVCYREKVIELPKHRQEETGIKRIRRRELLSYPERFCEKGEDEIINYSNDRKFDKTYQFLTGDRYPSNYTLVHRLNGFLYEEKLKKSIEEFKGEGLYFQDIAPKRKGHTTKFRAYKYDKETQYLVEDESYWNFQAEVSVFILACGVRTTWMNDQNSVMIKKPLFIFGDRNKSFTDYTESVMNNKYCEKLLGDKSAFGGLKTLQTILKGDKFPSTEFHSEIGVPCIKFPGIRPLKWCNAELAIMPTKKSLSILFFETGDEDKKEDKE